jgi:hypothetical protein
MTDDDPAVPIVCPECDTETEVSLSEVGEMLDRHNENQHDGEECAQVDPALADQLQNLVAEDMGLLD